MNPSHILVPIDRSELALRPIEEAPELFEGRKVTLFCAVDNLRAVPTGAPLAPPVDAPDLQKRIAEAREDLEKVAHALGKSSEVHIEVAADSNAAHAITTWAHENGVDLIVLSTHGRTGLRRLALGSIAEGVLRHAHVPVLAFPSKHPEE